MKKIYSLFAAVIFAATFNAQGAENFDAVPLTAGTGYTTASFTGADNTSWSLTSTRIINTSANYNITNSSALLSAGGAIKITYPNGLGTLTFQYRKAFTGGAARTIQVFVDGTLVNTSAEFGNGSGAQATVYNYSYPINQSGSVVVEVKVVGAQTTLDNFSWTAVPTMAVVDPTVSKTNLVKNTSVSTNILFAVKADVQIVNMNGQVVKAASVTENSAIDVSSLPRGTYVVTGVVNGKVTSQKVIKK